MLQSPKPNIAKLDDWTSSEFAFWTGFCYLQVLVGYLNDIGMPQNILQKDGN